MSLRLIIGPMFAGKTTEIIRTYNLYRFLKKRILVVNHTLNQRFQDVKQSIDDDEKCITSISTHDFVFLRHDFVLTTSKLQNIFEVPDFESFDVILIEELQFYDDAFDVVTQLVDLHQKIVISSGLDGDSERRPMGDVLKLIPYADTVERIVALCRECCDGTPGIFSSRMPSHCRRTNVIDVGAADKYQALCRKHYLKSNKSNITNEEVIPQDTVFV